MAACADAPAQARLRPARRTASQACRASPTINLACNVQDRAAKEAQAASDAARVAAAQRLDYWLAPGIAVKVRAFGAGEAGPCSNGCCFGCVALQHAVLAPGGLLTHVAHTDCSDVGRRAAHAWASQCFVRQVMAKKLADYYKKKGVVLRVIDKYLAEIEMSDSGDMLQVGGAGGRWALGVLRTAGTPCVCADTLFPLCRR